MHMLALLPFAADVIIASMLGTLPRLIHRVSSVIPFDSLIRIALLVQLEDRHKQQPRVQQQDAQQPKYDEKHQLEGVANVWFLQDLSKEGAIVMQFSRTCWPRCTCKDDASHGCEARLLGAERILLLLTLR